VRNYRSRNRAESILQSITTTMHWNYSGESNILWQEMVPIFLFQLNSKLFHKKRNS